MIKTIKIFIIICLFIVMISSGACTEEFNLLGATLEYDKILHFETGFIISDLTFHFQNNDDILLPIVIPTAFGLGKELIDGDFDWRDLGYTFLGAVTRSVLKVNFKF